MYNYVVWIRIICGGLKINTTIIRSNKHTQIYIISNISSEIQIFLPVLKYWYSNTKIHTLIICCLRIFISFLSCSEIQMFIPALKQMSIPDEIPMIIPVLNIHIYGCIFLLKCKCSFSEMQMIIPSLKYNCSFFLKYECSFCWNTNVRSFPTLKFK